MRKITVKSKYFLIEMDNNMCLRVLNGRAMVYTLSHVFKLNARQQGLIMNSLENTGVYEVAQTRKAA